MGLQPVEFGSLAGGLNLRDQPNGVEHSHALDLLNVTFTERGAVKSRDGYEAFTDSAGTARYDSLAAFYTSGGTKQILAGAGSRLEAIDTGGALLAASTSPTASPHYFARFGGPTAEIAFAGNGTDELRQWNGSAWSTPSWTGTAPTGRFVAVTEWDNRLVNARRAGSTAGDNKSTVRFSNAGDPLTWDSADYVDLTPGDGEEITGMVAWREFLFVFKQTKFFVLTGTGVGAAGTPTWTFRPVHAGVGLASSRAVVAARDGVYFLDKKGVYRTQGREPELMSPLLDPLFYGTSPSFFTGTPLNSGSITSCAMGYHREQVYLSYPQSGATANTHTLVYDPRYGWWTLYDIPMAAMVPFEDTSQPALIFAYASGENHLGRHAISLTTDAGATIASRWRSGWFDLDAHTRKTIREQLVWAKGKLKAGSAVDFGGVHNLTSMDLSAGTQEWDDDTWGDGSGADTWGSGLAAIAPGVNRSHERGTVFSFQFTNVDSTAWAVHRMTLRMRLTLGEKVY